ncbi:MAG TPA: hypothetical protein VFB50_05485 [Chloroflexota bacterium]|nr:hypothetical protein [Chloroflexota bacterium]
MPKVRTLVPLTHPKTGENFAAGTEVDVDDEVFAAWRADGKVSDLAAEQAEPEPTHYAERTAREDTVQTKPSSRSKG